MSADFGPPPKFDKLLGKSTKHESIDQNSPTLGLEPGRLKRAMADRPPSRQRLSAPGEEEAPEALEGPPPRAANALPGLQSPAAEAPNSGATTPGAPNPGGVGEPAMPEPPRAEPAPAIPAAPAPKATPVPSAAPEPVSPSAEVRGPSPDVQELRGRMSEMKLEVEKLRFLLQEKEKESAPMQQVAAQLLARLEAVEKAMASKPTDKKLEERLDQIERRVASVSNQSAVNGGAAVEAPVSLADDGGLSEFDIVLEKPPELEFELDDLLRVVIKHRASDLHIKPHAPPTVRLHGELIPIGRDRLTPAQAGYLVASGLPSYKRERILQRQEVDHAYVVEDVRFRVNAFLERGHLSGAYRMVDAVIPNFEELGLPPVLEQLASLKDGLVLVTGPAGSGKSTTLASVIDWINKNRKTHVVTIEDPIEYQHRDQEAFITQREVGSDTTSFTEALRQALRQDPNVIMLGEMRDAETILTAVTAAETGHLVLSTLHTPNAVQAVDRIVDTFSGSNQKQIRLLLSSCLRGVVSQKLLNRRSGAGRVPAVEVMLCTSTIASHILDGQTGEIYQYIQRGGNLGMQTFTQSLARLVEQGAITREEAMSHADQPTELRLMTEGKSTSTMGKDSEGYASFI